MPLEDTLFRLFPIEVQKGQAVEVCVVLFTQGINEQQSLADHIGDNTLQDTINAESYKVIRQYVTRFGEVFALAGGVGRGGVGQDVCVTCTNLLLCVQTPRSGREWPKPRHCLSDCRLR